MTAVSTFPANETERLEAVRAIREAGLARAQVFDVFVAHASKVLSCPIGALSLIEEDCQLVIAGYGFDEPSIPREISFCSWTILDDGPLVVADLAADPRFSHFPQVRSRDGLRAYAGVPIKAPTGQAIGALCVIDQRVHAFSKADIETLCSLAMVAEHLVTSGIANAEAARQMLRATAATSELARKNRLLEQTERLAGIGGWELDLATQALSWSDQVFRLHDLPVGPSPTVEEAILFYPETVRQSVVDNVGKAIAEGVGYDFDTDLVTATGRIRRVRGIGEVIDEDGRPARLIGVIQDITEQHETEQRLWHAANHDDLTGIGNRAFFNACMEALVAAGNRNGTGTGNGGGEAAVLLVIDLDGFKEINDTRGHAVGDEVLREVSRRISALCSDEDLAFRLGGDEFAVITRNAVRVAAADIFAEAVLEAIKQPMSIAGEPAYASATIGIARYPEDAVCFADLMRKADMALYNAKTEEPGTACAFTGEVSDQFERRRAAITLLRSAIREDRVRPFYQPKVSFRTGRIIGFESLARVMRPDGGILGPASFWPALMDPASVRELGQEMTRQVLEDMARWRRQGLPFGHVSLNVAQSDLSEEHFADELLLRLADFQIPAEALKIEITENVFLSADSSRVNATLARLSAAGIATALDDFGTGFASLTHLRQYDIQELKIDRSFTIGLGREANSTLIVKSVVDLGHNLGMTVVAEGIETEEQFGFLKAIGCDAGQGYWWHEPKCFDDATGLLIAEQAALGRPRLYAIGT